MNKSQNEAYFMNHESIASEEDSFAVHYYGRKFTSDEVEFLKDRFNQFLERHAE
jgi:hypothetical protein